MNTIEEQKTEAEKEVAAAQTALESAQQAFLATPSDENAQKIIECRDTVAKKQLLVDRADQLAAAAEAEREAAERAEAQALLKSLNDQLRDEDIAARLEHLVDREKVARLELMHVLMDREAVLAELREACYEAERVEDALNPAAAAIAPAATLRANQRAHRVATSASVAWARLVNAALEQAVALPSTVHQRDPRRNALRAVQI